MRLLSTARRTGLARGLLEGNRTWLVIGGAAWAVRGLQYALRPDAPSLYRTELEAGETIVITEAPAPPTRREQRRDRRDARRTAERERQSDRKQTKRDRRRSRRSKG
jgi:hypothetical protein